VRVGTGGFVFVGATVSIGAGVSVFTSDSGVSVGFGKVTVTCGPSVGFTSTAVGGTFVAVFADVGVARLSLDGVRRSEQQQHAEASISSEPQPPIALARRGPPTRVLNETQKLLKGLKEKRRRLIVFLYEL
jgi:hypothetical protein